MDPQIEELKELVRQNIALTTETNKILRGMRNTGRIKSVFWLLIFLASIAASVYSYYFFVAPRITEIKNIYETNILPLQNAGSGILNFLQNSSAPGSEAQ
jgi:hypothetical protein